MPATTGLFSVECFVPVGRTELEFLEVKNTPIATVSAIAKSFASFGPSPAEALASLSYQRPSTVLRRRVSGRCPLPAFVERS